MKIGIDDIAVYVSDLYLDLTGEFASARKIEVDKLKYGIGVTKISIADSYQDSVVLGANATKKLLEKNEIKTKEIGRIYVGSESRVDQSKPNAAYILGLLEKVFGKGSLRNCGAVDYTFACIGATYALEDMTNWIKAGSNGKKAGIVIATDISKYDRETSAESTQGAGSAVMSIKENPRLLALDNVWGTSTKDEADFFRPLNKETPVVNGKYSETCYLNAMRDALIDYETRVREVGLIKPREGEAVSDYIDYWVFHIPYPKMVKKATAYLLRHEWRDLPRWGAIEAQVGKEPKRTQFESEADFEDADAKYIKSFMNTIEFKDAFDKKVASSLVASKEIGNIYTGSIYLGLASTLETEHKAGKDITGKRFGFGSYGSGCSAKVFSGEIQPGWEKVVSKLDLFEKLSKRTPLTLQQYEESHKGERGISNPIKKPKGEFALVRVGTEELDEGYRYYEFIE